MSRAAATIRTRAAALVAPAVIGCVGCGSAASQHRLATISDPQSDHAQLVCVAARLRLSLGPPVSPATGEHAVILRLQNTATQRCAMSGYPATTLSHDRRPLPFVYQDGGGPYMGRRSPPSVVLGPGDDAYVLVAKYRCDGRDGAAANRLTFAIPHVPGKLTVTLNRPGVGQLSYCIRYPGDAAIDPGDRVAISPIEPTLAAVYALQQAA